MQSEIIRHMLEDRDGISDGIFALLFKPRSGR